MNTIILALASLATDPTDPRAGDRADYPAGFSATTRNFVDERA